jgi:hypothetical protein
MFYIWQLFFNLWWIKLYCPLFWDCHSEAVFLQISTECTDLIINLKHIVNSLLRWTYFCRSVRNMNKPEIVDCNVYRMSIFNRTLLLYELHQNASILHGYNLIFPHSSTGFQTKWNFLLLLHFGFLLELRLQNSCECYIPFPSHFDECSRFTALAVGKMPWHVRTHCDVTSHVTLAASLLLPASRLQPKHWIVHTRAGGL